MSRDEQRKETKRIWEEEQIRHQLCYPDTMVVRWIARNFGGITVFTFVSV